MGTHILSIDVEEDPDYSGGSFFSDYWEGGGETLNILGKCPKCDVELKENDIEEVKFRGLLLSHFAYRCSKCGYLIGFSSMFRG